MTTTQNTRLGIWLMIATCAVFAVQDSLSRHLGGSYNVWMVVAIRFWFFGLFALAVVARAPGGIGGALRSAYPGWQALRGLLLVTQICMIVLSFTLLGLVETHAVFVSYPLLVAALSGPILGERVGWRRWVAIAVGFAGVLVILQPGSGAFSPGALVPFVAALMFAVYGLMTRYVARRDTALTSFAWTGVVGGLAITPAGLWFWEPMTPGDWGWMAGLCLTGALSHYLLIKSYAVAEASAVQPFAYFQLPFAASLGLLIFGEELRVNVIAGAALVVGAGLFTLWRARLREKQAARAAAAVAGGGGGA